MNKQVQRLAAQAHRDETTGKWTVRTRFRPLNGRMPMQVARENLDLVTTVLTEMDADWFIVRNGVEHRHTVAVDRTHKVEFSKRLAACAPPHTYVMSIERGADLHLSRHAALRPELIASDLWRLGSLYRSRDGRFTVGLEHGCDVEFWDYEQLTTRQIVTAPRENVAARVLSVDELAPATLEFGGAQWPTREIFTRQLLDDIVFPVDAVYTWVDGEDPEWRESRRRVEAELSGYEYHPEANHAARFRSRDELRYSLRSLEMYAPWFRRIFIVTSGQVPAWLNTDHPQIQVVTHGEIYDDPSHLPTFNSNSIISRLHHIPGLSEHYVYLNDDVFFGRPVNPRQFFLPSGLALVSASGNSRPFGIPTSADEPHINLTRNIRKLLREEFGVTVSRAIKHTPHAQLRSVHYEMEELFKDVYMKTWSSRFRHHDDVVADQLHHYYAQLVGKAVPTFLRYNYINILDDQYRGVLEKTWLLRNRDTFCINDAPVEGATPIEDSLISEFFESYFPVKSSYER